MTITSTTISSVGVVCTVSGFDLHNSFLVDSLCEEFANMDVFLTEDHGLTTITALVHPSGLKQCLKNLPRRIRSSLSGVSVTDISLVLNRA